MNTNCLENRRCPECGQDSEVLIYSSMWVSLKDDGTDPHADSLGSRTGVDYDDSSDVCCPECGCECEFGEWDTERESDSEEFKNVR